VNSHCIARQSSLEHLSQLSHSYFDFIRACRHYSLFFFTDVVVKMLNLVENLLTLPLILRSEAAFKYSVDELEPTRLVDDRLEEHNQNHPEAEVCSKCNNVPHHVVVAPYIQINRRELLKGDSSFPRNLFCCTAKKYNLSDIEAWDDSAPFRQCVS
jgi:hypothetical protein